MTSGRIPLCFLAVFLLALLFLRFATPVHAQDTPSNSITLVNHSNPSIDITFAYTLTLDVRYEAEWGSEGTDEGQFMKPSGIAIDGDGNIYVADTHNHRIQKFGPRGNYLSQWGSYGSGILHFDSPTRIAIRSDGRVYVADSGNKRVQKFDLQGNYLGQLNMPSSNGDLMPAIKAMVVDGYGHLYILADNIHKFDVNDTLLAQWDKTPYLSQYMGVDSDGYIYSANWAVGVVYKFDSNGNHLGQWGVGERTGIAELPIGVPKFPYGPLGLAIGTSGYAYVLDIFDTSIQQFNLAGDYVNEWIPVDYSTELVWQHPVSMATDANDSIYVLMGNRIQKYALTPKVVSVVDKLASGESYSFTDLPWGTYSLQTSMPNNWALDNVSCDSDSRYDPVKERIAFDLHGQHITCTFTNTRMIGSITMANETSPSQGRVVDFSYRQPQYAFASEWGSQNIGHSKLRSPSKMTIDHQDSFYVVDPGYSSDRHLASREGQK